MINVEIKSNAANGKCQMANLRAFLTRDTNDVYALCAYDLLMRVYLRNGSNPTLKSGQDACADDPAGVSGQHSHPSNVPRQNLPVININGN